jgi:CheY-like chemotaxis protein
VRPTRKQVLVVDDERDVLEPLLEFLALEGYLVWAARDGREAIRMVLLHFPDAVLLDLVMPGVSGWQFLDMQASHPVLARIPVIVTSAVEHSLNVAAAISKPFHLDELLRTVHRVAGRPS